MTITYRAEQTALAFLIAAAGLYTAAKIVLQQIDRAFGGMLP